MHQNKMSWHHRLSESIVHNFNRCTTVNKTLPEKRCVENLPLPFVHEQNAIRLIRWIELLSTE